MPGTTRENALVRGIAESAHPCTGDHADFDPLISLAGGARFALLGEASHGTHEFYRIRGEITKRLIREHGFNAVAVEADWPDAYRVNRYVRGTGSDADADEALAGFKRFPQWMWRNADILDFVGWLRAENEARTADQRVGFYGLDLYSLHASIAAVLDYLRIVDPDAARRAKERYACFDHFGGDPQVYGYAVARVASDSCEDAVVAQLVELRTSAQTYASRDGRVDPDALFAAEQNARLVVRAEEYYRAMYRGRVSSWNLRDAHMAETLQALAKHLDQRTGRARIVVWAHNSHLGDARATQMGRAGEHNLGQLTRQSAGEDAVLVGFSTHAGTVTAASDWGEPAERKRVQPSIVGSFERLFHECGVPNFLLDLTRSTAVNRELAEPRLQRAIGVIYRPETERMSHYFDTSLPAQFDVILHYDNTRAVEPLERSAEWTRGEAELPETYPSTL